jgi:hypothetical protein
MHYAPLPPHALHFLSNASFQRLSQGPYQPGDTVRLGEGVGIGFHEPETNCQLKLSFELRQRSTRDSKKLHQFASGISCRPLRDIGRHGNRGAPDLIGQTKCLLLGKAGRISIDDLDESHGFLPRYQIPMGS